MASKTYAYIRVSTREQNEDRQLDAINDLNLPKENIFIDKLSGKDFNRPAYRQLIHKIRKGDLLIVKSIDRLGRNYEDIMEEWKFLTKMKKADIRVLDMPLLDTTVSKDLLGTLISDLVLQLLSFVAENERNNIHQRQAEGIAAAKARGVKFGRPSTELNDDFYCVYNQWQQENITTGEALKFLKISRSTFYRHIKKIQYP